MKKTTSRTRFWISPILSMVIILATTVSWTAAKSDNRSIQNQYVTRSASSTETIIPDFNWSKAILSVSNMSCGGCVENITASLVPLPGIGKISVDVTAGTADIFYNADELNNPKQIAEAITAAGYPAQIVRLVPTDQLRAEQRQMAKRSASHIASVGQLEISRQDFDMELSHARTRYQTLYGAAIFSDARGEQIMDRLKAQIATRLISNGIKLQEVDRAGYQISPQKVAQSMDAYLNQRQLSMDAFKTNLESSGYTLDYFKQRFSQRLRIQSYLDEVVLADSLDENDRQQRYTDWLTNATALAKVVYYDKALEKLVKSSRGSGCGANNCSVATK